MGGRRLANRALYVDLARMGFTCLPGKKTPLLDAMMFNTAR